MILPDEGGQLGLTPNLVSIFATYQDVARNSFNNFKSRETADLYFGIFATIDDFSIKFRHDFVATGPLLTEMFQTFVPTMTIYMQIIIVALREIRNMLDMSPEQAEVVEPVVLGCLKDYLILKWRDEDMDS